MFSERYKDLYVTEIQNNSSYYQVSAKYIEWIVEFLKNYPQMYQVLDESVKTLISSSINQLEQFLMCDFLSLNLENHYNIVLSRMNYEILSISEENLKRCFEKTREKDMLSKFLRFVLKSTAEVVILTVLMQTIINTFLHF